MLFILRQLFSRFAARHAEVDIGPMYLPDQTGALLGRIDSLQVRAGRLVVEGWTLADQVGPIYGVGMGLHAPTLLRKDVNAELGLPADSKLGFCFDLPFDLEPTFLACRRGSDIYFFSLPRPRPERWRRAQRACLPGFAAKALMSIPDALRWKLSRSSAARARIKTRLGFDHDQSVTHLLEPDLFSPALLTAPPDTAITVVLPVYNAFKLLPEVLERLVAHTDLPWHLVAVEDCSSDPTVRPWLREWANAQGAGRVTLLENTENLGFIGSVNRAFEQALTRGNHVVLLNSDTFLPAGWASRLLGPIVADASVATVTPISNDAEIFTAPAICARHDLKPGEADAIDAAAAQLGGGTLLAEAPTGVGFCMAMNIAALRAQPMLDTLFGHGYGEEVDWCQKARAHGFRHLGHGGLFVEHRGGQSFGNTNKQKLIANNNSRISQRYPRYDAEVQRFIRNDPMVGARLAQGLAWAGARAWPVAVPVYLTHSLGGGATHWLERQVAGDVERDGAAVVLSVGGIERWKISLHTPGGVTQGHTSDTTLMETLLALLPRRAIVYSCGVGDSDAIELPAILDRLSGGAGNTLEILFHDFFPLSPSYTLLNSAGLFKGVPMADEDDLAHQFRRPNGSWVSLVEWREAWGGALARADAVSVFSDNSRTLVSEAYPDIARRLNVHPHKLLHPVPEISAGTGWKGRPVIGVLGNIGYHKGAGVLRDMSLTLAKSCAARLVVVGNIDPTYALRRPALVHGDYQLDELPALVKRYGIDRWLIPSIWPETFSYAAHEALATALPVWAFDLGAQGAAVAQVATATGKGGVVALRNGEVPVSELLDLMLGKTEKSP